MKRGTIIGGILVMLIFIIVSVLLRETYAIWLQTRILGLAAFVGLFMTVVIGELRILKKQLRIFRFHKPIAIFTIYLVALHFIAAILDKFMWGKGVPFSQYLGFSFSNKWLLFLSLGAIAMYLMLLIGTTSSAKGMRFLGRKKWKLIHYSSYAAFTLAYIHSVNLGTDIKSSIVSPVVSLLFIGMFLFVFGLLLTRLGKGAHLITTQGEALVTAIIILTLLVTMAITTTTIVKNLDAIGELKTTTAIDAEQAAAYQARIPSIEAENRALQEELNGTSP